MDLNTLVEKAPLWLTGLWTGAAVYCAFISPRGRDRLDEKNKLTAWADEFRPSLPLMAGLAILSSVAGLYSYYVTNNLSYAYGAVSMALLLPYTSLFISPLYKKLLKADKDGAPSGTSGIIQQWVNAHRGRVLLGIVGGILYFFAEASPKILKASVVRS